MRQGIDPFVTLSKVRFTQIISSLAFSQLKLFSVCSIVFLMKLSIRSTFIGIDSCACSGETNKHRFNKKIIETENLKVVFELKGWLLNNRIMLRLCPFKLQKFNKSYDK